jgi:hypothetical protein
MLDCLGVPPLVTEPESLQLYFVLRTACAAVLLTLRKDRLHGLGDLQYSISSKSLTVSLQRQAARHPTQDCKAGFARLGRLLLAGSIQ